jgi:FkbM family methyltransferase
MPPSGRARATLRTIGRRLTRRLARLVPPSSGPEATPEDVHYCYRLLLGRPPDAEGRAHLAEVLPGLTVDDLVRRFLNSTEFRSRPLVLETIGGDGEPVEAVDVGDFVVHVRAHDQDIGGAIRRERTYEPHVSARLRSLVRPGDTVVDVGANIGWFTLLAARLTGEGGAVHAVEANARNTNLLRRSVQANGFEDVVRIHPVAASDSAGTMVLAPQAGSNGIVDDAAWYSVQFDGQLVHALALDDLLAELDRLDVVKIDIEGGELRALRGFAGLLGRFRPHVLAEYSPALLRTVSRCDPAELLAFWDDLGYEATLLLPGADPEPTKLDAAVLDDARRRAGSDHVDLHLSPR